MSTSASLAVEVDCSIDAALAAFSGHFPGAPVLPGAYLMALVQRAIIQHLPALGGVSEPKRLVQMKFLAAVEPGQTLRIRLELLSEGGVAFTVHRSATVIARGQFK